MPMRMLKITTIIIIARDYAITSEKLNFYREITPTSCSVFMCSSSQQYKNLSLVRTLPAYYVLEVMIRLGSVIFRVNYIINR